jgi:Tfp pilus assembly protein PilF
MNRRTSCVQGLLIASLFLATMLPAGAGLEGHASLASQQDSAQTEQAERLVAEGVAALERGDTKAAKVAFQRAVKIAPNDVTAHTYLGILADRAGDLAEAERHFAAAAINAPLSPAARNNHGAILLRLGRIREAATQFETSLKLDQMQPNALVNLAQIRFSSNTPEGLRAARGLFERARAITPDAEIARALVVITLRLKERDAAGEYYRDYAARLSSAPDAVTKASARAELGAALLEAGLAAEAIDELSAAVSAEPSDVGAILMLARAYQSRKDIVAAGRTLESAVARGLEAPPIYAALAEIYEASGHIENAIPAMRLAIQRDPKNEAYRFRYGMLLTDTKAPGAAVIRLEEALTVFPRSPRLWLALGVAQSALDKYDEAAKAFSRALELDPKFAPALAYLGMIYDQQGRYAEAVALYERALAIDDGLAAAHYLAADARLKQEPADTKPAETHLRRAIELDPSFAPARLAVAKLYVRREQYAEAAEQLEKAIASDPNSAQAYYQLGRVYLRLKRAKEAQTVLAKFKQLSETERERSKNEHRDIARRLADVRF